VRCGAINGGSFELGSAKEELSEGLLSLKLHEIDSWSSAVNGESILHNLNSSRKDLLVKWLEEKLPTTHPK
jgi:hypothetical protein